MGWLEKSCGRTQYSYHGQILHKSHLKTNVWIIGPQSGGNWRFSQQNGEINISIGLMNPKSLDLKITHFLTASSAHAVLKVDLLWTYLTSAFSLNYFRIEEECSKNI